MKFGLTKIVPNRCLFARRTLIITRLNQNNQEKKTFNEKSAQFENGQKTNLSKKKISGENTAETSIGNYLKEIFKKYNIGFIAFLSSICSIMWVVKHWFINDAVAEFIPGSLKGKTILVTGASSGYGKLISEEIVRRGGKVIMASRSLHNLRLARDQIVMYHPDAEIEITHLDLASLDSVGNCAYKVLARYGTVDMIINNAAIFQPKGKRDSPETDDGFERQFQVNFLGHFLLSELLKDHIVKNGGRIVNILCTSMQKATLTLDPLNKKSTFKDILRDPSQMVREKVSSVADEEEIKQFGYNEAYMQSKLCLWLYTRHLGRQFLNMTSAENNLPVSVGVDPGASQSTLFGRYSYTDYSFKATAKYPVDLFMGLFERNQENNIQSVISALHQIPDYTDAQIQGKVISKHSTQFYDDRTAPLEGKRKYLQDVVLVEGVEQQIYNIGELWSDLEKRKITLRHNLSKNKG